jgi:hypothetical protein
LAQIADAIGRAFPLDIGHMLGVFKATDGTTWVTSNEEFRQVNPSDAKAGVTQADPDATMRKVMSEMHPDEDPKCIPMRI